MSPDMARTGLRRNLLANTAVGMAGLVAQLALLPLVLRALGPQEYGRWAPLLVLVQFAAVADAGVGAALTVRLSGLTHPQEVRAYQGAARTLYLVGGAAVAALTLGVEVGLAAAQGRPADLALAGLAGVVGVALPWSTRPAVVTLQAAGRFDVERGLFAAALAIRVVLTVFALLVHPTLLLLAFCDVVALPFGGALCVLSTRWTGLPAARARAATRLTVKDLLSFSRRAGGQSLLGLAGVHLNPLLGALLVAPAAAGAYAAAYRTALTGRQLLSWVSEPFLPLAAAQPDRDRLGAVHRTMARCCVLPAVGALGLAGLAPVVAPVLLGQAFSTDAGLTLGILLVNMALVSLLQPQWVTAAAADAPAAFLRVNAVVLLATAAVVPTALVLTGPAGAAAATLLLTAVTVPACDRVVAELLGRSDLAVLALAIRLAPLGLVAVLGHVALRVMGSPVLAPVTLALGVCAGWTVVHHGLPVRQLLRRQAVLA